MRTVIYARYSSDNQREASIEDQVYNCRSWIEAEGWQLINTYSDASALSHGHGRPRSISSPMCCPTSIESAPLWIANWASPLSRSPQRNRPRRRSPGHLPAAIWASAGKDGPYLHPP